MNLGGGLRTLLARSYCGNFLFRKQHVLTHMYRVEYTPKLARVCSDRLQPPFLPKEAVQLVRYMAFGVFDDGIGVQHFRRRHTISGQYEYLYSYKYHLSRENGNSSTAVARPLPCLPKLTFSTLHMRLFVKTGYGRTRGMFSGGHSKNTSRSLPDASRTVASSTAPPFNLTKKN